MNSEAQIAVIGGGSWATALVKILCNNSKNVGWWVRSKETADYINKYHHNPVNEIDGLKIEFDNDWVHLRTSNTEPIIRIYAESTFETTADNIAMRLMKDIKEAI